MWWNQQKNRPKKRRQNMIVKRKDGYHVVSEQGKNLGGPYQSREQAHRRLAQVEYFKHQKPRIGGKR